MFWKTQFWILCIPLFCYFYGDFCDPNFQILSSWTFLQTSWSFTYFNFRIFGLNMSDTMAWFLDRVKLPRMGISVMFTLSLFSTRFSRLILKNFPSQKLLRTSFSINYINLGIFQDDLNSEQSLLWKIRILFQQTVFSLSLSY